MSEVLIDVAARVIVARGFAAITLRDVADAAGIQNEVVESVFHRKESLVTAIVDRAAALFTTPLDEGVAVDGDRERLETLLVRQLTLVDENRDLFLVAILRLLRPTEYPVVVPRLEFGLTRLEHYFFRFDEWLSTNVRQTEPRIVNGHVAGGAIVGMLARWAANGGNERAERWARPLASMLVR